ncbi:MAG: FMN-binding protein [Lachnospiraceae bacterium]|uniref:FMN-binding protein n=1 Tax=Clostridium sp. (strain SY8519) TaxID=1042156 RepID=UPI0002171B15|nr:FMN-binding protein [Clostridium sp. SY8519]MCI1654760.1 FMN-binding protein [Lachnospiraceae bacterium]MCI1657183.1 FMN-binding protein [Lachnospiraceae bacterium]MCI2195600.1 FMN-binding protein [Lachnospiraceae bacterium]BAK46413.1 hypothetical protein CXIVA_04460 [Clostridium sp. SY8519]
MSQTISRVVNVCLIAGLLFVYQQAAAERKQSTEMYEKQKEQVEELAKSYRKQAVQKEASSAGTEETNKEGTYKDGTYEGTGTGYGGKISVKAVITGGRIKEVKIISAKGEDSAYLSQASKLLDQIVEEQSTDLDAVSGATYSSNGILDAADDALEGAR